MKIMQNKKIIIHFYNTLNKYIYVSIVTSKSLASPDSFMSSQ